MPTNIMNIKSSILFTFKTKTTTTTKKEGIMLWFYVILKSQVLEFCELDLLNKHKKIQPLKKEKIF